MNSEHFVIVYHHQYTNHDDTESSACDKIVVFSEQEKMEADNLQAMPERSGSISRKPTTESTETENSTTSSSQVQMFRCPNCSYISRTEHLLQKHIQTQHNPHRKLFSCSHCTYICLQERTFRLHQSKHTATDAKFACDQCGKLFLSMGMMKRHALTHSKMRPFVCDRKECGKSFKIKSRLTDHKRYVHDKFVGDDNLNQDLSCRKSKLRSNYDCYSISSQQDWTNMELKSTRNIISSGDIDGDPEETKSVNHVNVVQNLNPTLSENSAHNPASNASSTLLPSYILSDETSRDKTSGSDKTRNHADPSIITVYDIVLSTHREQSTEFDIDCENKNSTVIQENRLKDKKLKLKLKPQKFSCSWLGCGKTFRDCYNLRMHVCTHTGEMQRACKLCGYTCIQKSALDRHMKIH